MRFGDHGSANKWEVAKAQENWDAHCCTRTQGAMDSAKRWANAMEACIAKQPNAQVRSIAESTLYKTCGQGVTTKRLQELVEILEDTWYLGYSLRRWYDN